MRYDGTGDIDETGMGLHCMKCIILFVNLLSPKCLCITCANVTNVEGREPKRRYHGSIQYVQEISRLYEYKLGKKCGKENAV